MESLRALLIYVGISSKMKKGRAPFYEVFSASASSSNVLNLGSKTFFAAS